MTWTPLFKEKGVDHLPMIELMAGKTGITAKDVDLWIGRGGCRCPVKIGLLEIDNC